MARRTKVTWKHPVDRRSPVLNWNLAEVGRLERLYMVTTCNDNRRVSTHEQYGENPLRVLITKRGRPLLIFGGFYIPVEVVLEKKLMRFRTLDGWVSFQSPTRIASDTFSMKVRLSKTARSAGPRERKNPREGKRKNTPGPRRASRKKTA